MADGGQEAEELENWIDDTREKIFRVLLNFVHNDDLFVIHSEYLN